VFEGNERARRFYTSCGWKPTGERRLDDWTVIPELRLVRGARQTPDHGQPNRSR
jgi:RimJ/RimL family protein N-acetyltransferase